MNLHEVITTAPDLVEIVRFVEWYYMHNGWEARAVRANPNGKGIQIYENGKWWRENMIQMRRLKRYYIRTGDYRP